MNLAQAQAYLKSRGLHRSQRRDLMHERVRQEGAVTLRSWTEQGGVRNPVRYARPRFRNFTAGDSNMLTGAWSSSDIHVNQSLFRHLRTLRARSNDLAKNNDYARIYLGLVKENVAGPMGQTLQVQARRRGGELDRERSDLIENAFADWGKRENCDVLGELSWVEIQRLWIETMARAGEVLVRRHRGRGKYAYHLELIDPALLDETYNLDLTEGRKIRMGIELDANGRRVAYHISKSNPADPRIFFVSQVREYMRIPADEIWHDFVPEWIGQLRGVPWMSTTLIRQKRLSAFEEAAVLAAEEGAKKLAFIKTPDGNLGTLADQIVRDKGESEADDNEEPVGGTLITESGEGIHYARLFPGQEVVNWDPKYPDAAVGPFRKEIVRGLSAGLRVQYHKVGNDLADVNFSSMRGGELTERDFWKGLQQFQRERLQDRIYAEWLPLAVLANQIALPPAQLDRFPGRFQGRGWDWVDPKSDVAAVEKAIALKITSRRREILRRGEDPDDIFEEAEQEEQRFGPVKPQAPPPAADPAQDPAATDTPADGGDGTAGARDAELITDAIVALQDWQRTSDGRLRALHETVRDGRQERLAETIAQAAQLQAENTERLIEELARRAGPQAVEISLVQPARTKTVTTPGGRTFTMTESTEGA